jgi:WS/DGAT/MGAT family acyltransferase
MDQEPLSKADYALLRLDSQRNRLTVTGLIVLSTRLDLELFQRTLEQKLLPYRRFRQRVVFPYTLFGNAYWEEDPKFNLDYHLTYIKTPLPGNPALLQETISRVMSTGLDPARPLWRFFIVEHYGQGSALVIRMHHSIADGMSLVKFLISITDKEPGYEAEPVIPAATQPENSMPAQQHFEQPDFLTYLRKLAAQGEQVLKQEGALEELTRMGVGTATAFARLLTGVPDRPNIYKGNTGVPKRAAWTPGIPLQDIKAISKALDCTINDILLSAVVGALRRYQDLHDRVDRVNELHSFIPVDLRRGSRQQGMRFFLESSFNGEFGNRFGFAILGLPVAMEDPVDRLREIRQKMDFYKASGDALVSYLVLSLLGFVPGEIQDLAADFWITKGSLVLTNVAGPTYQLYLSGSPVETVMGWVPQYGKIGLGISIFSYNGKVVLGVASDQGLVPDPEKIGNLIMEEYNLLAERVQQVDSPDGGD